ncbi:glutamate receptor 2.2 [Rhynchospora pubera]|uniref:Glutamate receptor n=2 Tax=Rhynchospora pubera TaxID=906938 RepID=A0AAV8G816_9POAL|nr:glutamate receptor 2.2 [Rhynchospora pubera]
MKKIPCTNLYQYLSLCFIILTSQVVLIKAQRTIDVGALLDFTSPRGRAGQAAISIALEDFYALNANYSTRLAVHVRDCKQDDISAASAAIDLLKNIRVQAIIGPRTSTQAKFVSDLGNQTHIPIISYSATSPTLSSDHTPFFLRTTVNDSSQVGAITAIVSHFGWHEAVPVYEDSDFGMGMIPYLVDSLQEINTQVPYRSVIHSYATDEQINLELLKLKTMPTRVFIVHMMSDLAARIFSKASENDMMSAGYVWIITDSIANVIDSIGPLAINSMQGVIGVRPYIESTKKIADFTRSLKSRLRQENPNIDLPEPTVYELWAYDTVWAVSMAVENAQLPDEKEWVSQIGENSTDLGRLAVCKTGTRLLNLILDTAFDGIAGKFHLVDRQLQSSNFEIVNVIGKSYQQLGFWTTQVGFASTPTFTASSVLKPVIWPGHSTATPKGWQIPTAGKKLRVGVPLKDGFQQFVKIERNKVTNQTTVTGYCIDMFDAVMQSLPYYVPYEYVALEDGDGPSNLTYTQMVEGVYLKKYDAFVGDTTIIANRSLFVDFTLPYTDTGVQMVVPIRDKRSTSMWIFLKPLEDDLWLAIILLFAYTGFVVWLIEHRSNVEFGGTRKQQLLNISFFSFFTFLGIPKERVLNNLSKFAVINWMLVAWLLEKNYSASLTSMMTVQRLQPTVSDINELLKSGEFIGYQHQSFVEDLLKSLNFDENKLRSYSSSDQYAEALSKGSTNGGVAAIFDEIPFLNLLITEHCNQYAMVGRIYKTGGFGFVFQKGSPLVPDVSRAILNVTEGDKIVEINRAWFGDDVSCSTQENTFNYDRLSFHSFRGVFLITAVLWGLALFISVVLFLLKKISAENISTKVRNVEVLPFSEHKEGDQVASSTEVINYAHEDDVGENWGTNKINVSQKVAFQAEELSYPEASC